MVSSFIQTIYPACFMKLKLKALRRKYSAILKITETFKNPLYIQIVDCMNFKVLSCIYNARILNLYSLHLTLHVAPKRLNVL